jgi:exodeoxyribonuclease VII small subunit
MDEGKDNNEAFEKVLEKLEGVVQKLERADLPLEQAILAYEEGLALVKRAQGKLDGMDAKLEQLLHGKTTSLSADKNTKGA